MNDKMSCKIGDSSNLNFCIYEDRKEDYVAVKLLVLSILNTHPEARIFLMGENCSKLQIPKDFCSEQIFRVPDFTPKLHGWNTKPEALLYLLEQGLERVYWLDSDLLFVRELPERILFPDPSTIIVAEETHSVGRQGSGLRTSAWGLQPGRTLYGTANSCVLSVSTHHVDLLGEYRDMLSSDAYRSSMQEAFHLRPLHMAGDQDVLTALLGSHNYADLEIVWIQAGREIAQCFRADGFSVSDRIACLLGRTPSLIHAQGPKPWREYACRPVYLELSPYRYAALQYAQSLEPEESAWLPLTRNLAMFWDTLFMGNACLSGIPATITYRVERRWRQLLRKLGRNAKPLTLKKPQESDFSS